MKQNELSIDTEENNLKNSFSIFNNKYYYNDGNNEKINSIHKRYSTEFIKSKNFDTENSVKLNLTNNEILKSNSMIENNSNSKKNQILKEEKNEKIINSIKENNSSERKNVTLNLANGKYIGTINKDGKFDGKGIFYFKNGDIYEGEYKNGFRDGKGIYKYVNGEIFEGLFIKGKAEGFGILNYKNGYYYKGNWKNDLKEGKGEYYNAKTKTLISGIWSKGKRIKN
jgi:hypothetical protein